VSQPFTPDLLKAAQPETARDLALPRLEAPVAVFRDAHGIPHVRARSAHDAFFGQGFVTAQDRLWQMEYDRRRALGRWSEVVGPSALPQDRQMRRFQLGRNLGTDFQSLAPETRAMLEAYADGVNAAIARGGPLPPEFAVVGLTPEPWRPTDSLAVMKVRHILMGVFEHKLWRARMVRRLGAEATARLHLDYQSGTPLVVPPGADFAGPMEDALEALAAGAEHLAAMGDSDPDAGSNNWVVGGSRTASGLPLLAGDPHRALDVPNVYYQNHVACETFDVIGFSFPGVPGFPHFAHNAHVAWSITHGNGDSQDLYLERFDPAQPTRYRFRDEWRPAEVTTETIHVKGAAPETLELVHTHHGPVIGGDPASGAALAFRFTATAEPNRTLDGVRAMLAARSADELEAAMQRWVDPVNNMVYCDAAGSFGYRTRGTVPVRNPANAWLPVPGWSGAHEWQGVVPFAEMPAVRNPARGWVATANNRIVGRDFPHYIGLDFSPGTRAERIRQLLDAATGLTPADMARFQADVTSVPAAALAPLLAAAEPPDADCAAALALLRGWDGALARDAPAATVFSAWREFLLRELLTRHLGDLAPALLEIQGRGSRRFLAKLVSQLHRIVAGEVPALLPPDEARGAWLGAALAGAVAYLRERLGPDPAAWRWDALHRSVPRHLLSAAHPEAAAWLDPPPIPMGGDGDTIQAASHAFWAKGFEVVSQSVARYVFDPADWERSGWVVPTGASGRPGSLHYADQAPLYERGELLPMTYAWPEVEARAVTRQTLAPAPR